MRKGRDGEKNPGKTGKKREKTDDYSGHYVIASSRPPERRPLVPIIEMIIKLRYFLLTHRLTDILDDNDDVGGVPKFWKICWHDKHYLTIHLNLSVLVCYWIETFKKSVLKVFC